MERRWRCLIEVIVVFWERWHSALSEPTPRGRKLAMPVTAAVRLFRFAGATFVLSGCLSREPRWDRPGSGQRSRHVQWRSRERRRPGRGRVDRQRRRWRGGAAPVGGISGGGAIDTSSGAPRPVCEVLSPACHPDTGSRSRSGPAGAGREHSARAAGAADVWLSQLRLQLRRPVFSAATAGRAGPARLGDARRAARGAAARSRACHRVSDPGGARGELRHRPGGAHR